MSIFNQIPHSVIRENFIYRGWLFGLVPVYVGDLSGRCPDVAVRNGVPDCLLDIVEGLYSGFLCLMGTLRPDLEHIPYIAITERLDGAPIAPGELP